MGVKFSCFRRHARFLQGIFHFLLQSLKVLRGSNSGPEHRGLPPWREDAGALYCQRKRRKSQCSQGFVNGAETDAVHRADKSEGEVELFRGHPASAGQTETEPAEVPPDLFRRVNSNKETVHDVDKTLKNNHKEITALAVNTLWQQVDTVLLDMDGTLLDKHFDDHFWEEFVPKVYAEKNNITIRRAMDELHARYRSLEGTLQWTDLDYWSDELGLDIPALKNQVDHLIAVHPYVVDFLSFCKINGKGLFLVTNAHSRTLEIKLKKTAIGPWFEKIVCSQQIGLPKEDPHFWRRLEERLGFDRKRTLLADDTEQVLVSARTYGMGVCVFVARPSSTRPTAASSRFPSIVYFKELLPV